MSDTLPPGPWSIEYNQHSDTWLVYGPHSAEPFVEVETYCNPDSEDALMRLWAAAPELLEALRAALRHLEDHEAEWAEQHPAANQARTAIARATGEAVTA